MLSPVLLLLRRAGREPGAVAQRLRDAGAIVLTGAFYESPIDAVADASPTIAFVEDGHEALAMPQFLHEVESAGAALVRFDVEENGEIAREVLDVAAARAERRELVELVAQRRRATPSHLRVRGDRPADVRRGRGLRFEGSYHSVDRASFAEPDAGSYTP